MTGVRAAAVGAVILGALNTVGDFIWAEFVPRHRAIYGLAHGLVLLMTLGLYLGLLRKRPLAGALSGAAIGLGAAAAYYALAPLLGYWAMLTSWLALWAGFAYLDARLRGSVARTRRKCVRASSFLPARA